MTATDRQRRRLLKGLAASVCTPVLVACKGPQNEQLMLSTARQADGQYVLCCFDSAGTIRWKHSVDHRAHDVVVHPSLPQAAFFARRPGKHVWIMDVHNGTLLQQLASEEGWHFNGHGCFSSNGQKLYTTETALNPTRGKIGIWDWPNAQRLGNLDSGGLDPHQCLIIHQGKTLVVANGGIDTGRARNKLNLSHMKSNLSYLSLKNGRILRQETAEHQQLSIRHIAQLADDRIVVGMQFEGDKTLHPPLVAIATNQQGLHALPPPKQEWASLKHYIASVATDAQGKYVAATSPRGGHIVIWKIRNSQQAQQLPLVDVAGLVGTQHGFSATSGLGIIARWQKGTPLQLLRSPADPLTWDNHATIVSA